MAFEDISTPSPVSRDLQARVTVEALDEVLYQLTDNMKPKARQRARAKLEAYADRLETWRGRRLPANVTPIRGLRGAERDRADERQRQEAAVKAEALRVLIGRAFQ